MFPSRISFNAFALYSLSLSHTLPLSLSRSVAVHCDAELHKPKAALALSTAVKAGNHKGGDTKKKGGDLDEEPDWSRQGKSRGHADDRKAAARKLMRA